jgi:hypothetical protein
VNQKVAMLIPVLLAASCTTVRADPPAYDFRVVDDTDGQAFVFELTSRDARFLCFGADYWPYVDGATVWNPVELVTTTGKLMPREYGNSDAGMLCGLSRDRDCGKSRLDPYQVQTARLDYALFADPAVLAADKARHIDLHPEFPFVTVCHNQKSRAH